MPTFRDRGIVLRTKKLRDADRHYAIFTERHGKIVVLAKGSRKGKSKMAPHLGSFGVVDVMVAKGRIIDRLAGASLEVVHRGVFDSLERSALAQTVLLAVDALVKRDLPDERVFSLLTDFLAVLDSADVPERGPRHLLFDAVLHRLLDLLGFAVDLRACVRCRRPLVPQGNAFNAIAGGIECAACRDPRAPAIDADTIKVLRFLREGHLNAVPFLVVAAPVRRDVAAITDLLLSTQLEDRLSALGFLRAVA